MLQNLLVNKYAACAVILFGIGFTMLLLHQNLIRKIIGLNIMDTAVYLFLAAEGFISGRTAPIIVNGVREAAAEPRPAGAVLWLSFEPYRFERGFANVCARPSGALAVGLYKI